jgi:hypothetical protein
MRVALPIVALVLTALIGVAARGAHAAPPPTVPCGDIIDYPKFPYPNAGYRLLLGVISAPAARLSHAYPSDSRPWTYFLKAGLIIGKGASVSVSVPIAWRSRLAIVWGNSTPIVSSLRIAACESEPNVGHAYAGGFYLRSRSACVPLIFRVGQRSATVRFGIGRACGAAN